MLSNHQLKHPLLLPALFSMCLPERLPQICPLKDTQSTCPERGGRSGAGRPEGLGANERVNDVRMLVLGLQVQAPFREAYFFFTGGKL